MSYDFPTDLQTLVRAKMATGKYASEDELLRQALVVLSDHEDAVANIQEGLDDEAAGRLRPFNMVTQHLETAYRQMAQDEEREAEALEWAESTTGDVADEAR